jgi:hypothetical protein
MSERCQCEAEFHPPDCHGLADDLDHFPLRAINQHLNLDFGILYSQGNLTPVNRSYECPRRRRLSRKEGNA